MQTITFEGPSSATIHVSPSLKTDLEKVMSLRLKKAAKGLRDKYYQALGRPYPPASRPGEIPHKRTSRGRDNVKVRVGRSEVTVYLDQPGIHLYYLEAYQNRPWFLRILQNYYPKLEKTLKGE